MAAFNYPYPAYNQMYSPMQAYQPPVYPQTQQMVAASSQPQQQGNQGLSNASRPVTNREEAMGVPADFSGALMVFPDLSNNRVYLKRWNMQTGSADFGEFAPVIPANNEPQKTAAFASLEDFQGLQETVEDLKKEIERMKKPAGKVVKKNDADE